MPTQSEILAKLISKGEAFPKPVTVPQAFAGGLFGAIPRMGESIVKLGERLGVAPPGTAEAIEEKLPPAPGLAGFVGTALGQVPLSAFAAIARTPWAIRTVLGLFALSGAGGMAGDVEELRRKGKKVSLAEEAALITGAGVMEALSEYLPIRYVAKRLAMPALKDLGHRVAIGDFPGAKRAALMLIDTTAVEGLEEVANQVVDNLLLRTIDENKRIMEGVGESFLGGAIGGLALAGTGLTFEAFKRSNEIRARYAEIVERRKRVLRELPVAATLPVPEAVVKAAGAYGPTRAVNAERVGDVAAVMAAENLRVTRRTYQDPRKWGENKLPFRLLRDKDEPGRYVTSKADGLGRTYVVQKEEGVQPRIYMIREGETIPLVPTASVKDVRAAARFIRDFFWVPKKPAAPATAMEKPPIGAFMKTLTSEGYYEIDLEPSRNVDKRFGFKISVALTLGNALAVTDITPTGKIGLDSTMFVSFQREAGTGVPVAVRAKDVIVHFIMEEAAHINAEAVALPPIPELLSTLRKYGDVEVDEDGYLVQLSTSTMRALREGRPKTPEQVEKEHLAKPFLDAGLIKGVAYLPVPFHRDGVEVLGAVRNGHVVLGPSFDAGIFAHEVTHMLLRSLGGHDPIVREAVRKFGGHERLAEAMEGYFAERYLPRSVLLDVRDFLEKLAARAKKVLGVDLTQKEILGILFDKMHGVRFERRIPSSEILYKGPTRYQPGLRNVDKVLADDRVKAIFAESVEKLVKRAMPLADWQKKWPDLPPNQQVLAEAQERILRGKRRYLKRILHQALVPEEPTGLDTPDVVALRLLEVGLVGDWIRAKRGKGKEELHRLRTMATHAVSRAQRQAGFVLQTFRIEVGEGPAKTPEEYFLALEARAKREGKTEQFNRFRDEIAKVIVTVKNPARANVEIERIANAVFGEGFKTRLLSDLYASNLLTGPATQIVNVLTTAFSVAHEFVTRPLLGLIDATLHGLGLTKARSYFVDEIFPMLSGIKPGAKKGAKVAWIALKEGRAPDRGKLTYDMPASMAGLLTSWDQHPDPRIRALAPITTWGIRSMVASDLLLRSIVVDAEMRARAHRLAKREGLKGKEYEARTRELMQLPTNLLPAVQYASHVVFNDAPGPILARFLALRASLPANMGRFVVPFATTIVNLMRRGIELTPGIGALYSIPGMKRFEEAKIKGYRKFGKPLMIPPAQVVLNQVEGAILLLVAALLLDDDHLTGEAPRNPAERAHFYAMGRIPYAFRIPGTKTWISYGRLEPFSYVLKTFADIRDVINEGPEDNESVTDRFMRAAELLGKTYIGGSPFVDGVNRMLTEQGFKRTLLSLPANLVPWSSLWRTVNRVALGLGKGVKIYDKDNLWAFLAQTLPFGHKYLDPGTVRLGAFGEELTLPGGTMMAWMPYPVAEENDDPVERMLHELDVYPGLPSKTLRVGTEDVEIPEDLYVEYALVYGARSKEALRMLAGNKRFRSMERPIQIIYINRYIEQARRPVREYMRAMLAARMKGAA